MITNGAHAHEADDSTIPARHGAGRAGRASRVALRSAAVLALLAGAATATGLAGTTPAMAATTATSPHEGITPACQAQHYSNGYLDPANWQCSEDFTQSGYFTTADIDSDKITFELAGGNGGQSGNGTAGGTGDAVITTYTVPSSWGGFASFQVNVGGNGSNGSSDGAGGAGGAGGGAPGGNGSGGNGTGTGGGGGGGGATSVYVSDSLNPAGGTLLGVAGGGGGAADREPGGNAADAGAGPSGCGGGAGSGTAGGGGGQCVGEDSTSGGNGAAGSGGSGATPTCQGDACLTDAYGTGGGGGGGGGLYGGGGGGSIGDDDISGGGGGGSSSSLPEVASSMFPFGNDSPMVIISWTTGSGQTQTALALSQSTATAGTAVTASASVTSTGYGWTPAGGSVQFAVDGNDVGSPEPVTGANVTLPPLAPGNHQVTATYTPPGTLPYLQGSTSSAQLVVTGQSLSITYPWAPGPKLIEVNMTNYGTDIWQQVNSGSSPVANEQWAYTPAGNGYAYLINEQTGYCLEVNGTTGAVDTWSCVPGAENELWREVDDPTENMQGLQVESSGEYLALAPGDLSNGAPLTMSSSLDQNDAWIFTATGGSSPS